jgi:hypothetical protein
VSRLEARFNDNFRMAAGLLATIQKGSSVSFEQGLVNNELWLPTGGVVDVGARVLLVKGYHLRLHVKDSEYQRFHAEASEQPGQKQ